MHIVLRTGPNATPLAAQLDAVSYNQFGHVTIRAKDHLITLAGDGRYLAGRLRELAAKLDRLPAQTVMTISPEEVIDYFEASPVLAEYAADVRAALEPIMAADSSGRDARKLEPHRSELLDDQGKPVYGYTRRAAEILFGNPSLNGGSNLARIKAALQKLRKGTTTTAISGENGPNEVKRAA